MYSVDIVMQGPVNEKTYTTAESYFTLPWVKRVFISTWEGQNSWDTNYRIVVIKSPDPPNPGVNNRNRQIYSSQAGITRCDADIIIKTRSDQQVSISSMKKMYEFFWKNCFIDKKFLDGSGPKGAIFTIGLYSGYVFHPEDHLFWGFQKDILKLYDIPLDPIVPTNINDPVVRDAGEFAHKYVRPNAYLGMHYYARFDERIKYMTEHPGDFIVDNAPGRAEAFERELPFKDVIFKAFPKIDLWWEKYNMPYPYETGIAYSEYWGKSWE